MSDQDLKDKQKALKARIERVNKKIKRKEAHPSAKGLVKKLKGELKDVKKTIKGRKATRDAYKNKPGFRDLADLQASFLGGGQEYSIESIKEQRKIKKEIKERLQKLFNKSGDKMNDAIIKLKALKENKKMAPSLVKRDTKIFEKQIKEAKKDMKGWKDAAKAQKIELGPYINKFRRMQMEGKLIGGRKHSGINKQTGKLKKGYKYVKGGRIVKV